MPPEENNTNYKFGAMYVKDDSTKEYVELCPITEAPYEITSRSGELRVFQPYEGETVVLDFKVLD